MTTDVLVSVPSARTNGPTLPTAPASPVSRPRLRRMLAVGARCPDCGGPLAYGEGCRLCPVCGHSSCA